jgi:hypothetical protein
MGSMSWSTGAVRNSEDLNLAVSPEFAQTYAAHWAPHLAVSHRKSRVKYATAPSFFVKRFASTQI